MPDDGSRSRPRQSGDTAAAALSKPVGSRPNTRKGDERGQRPAKHRVDSGSGNHGWLRGRKGCGGSNVSLFYALSV